VERLGAHFWTVYPHIRDTIAGRYGLRAARPWSAVVQDLRRGPVQLTGDLRVAGTSSELVILVHGLGGGPRSPYVLAAARDLGRAGVSTLALALRGADLRGDDYYHAALTADLHAAVASPAVQRFDRVFCLGFSMGGHVAMVFAAENEDPRLRGVVAVCSPLDLATIARHVDAARGLYLRHVLNGVKAIYRANGRGPHRDRLPTPVAEVLAISTIRDWDRLAIVPRFGFRDVDDYHAQASAARYLSALRVPTLLIATRHDPLVPEACIAPYAGAGSALFSLRWLDRAGHVGFPRSARFDDRGPPGLAPQAWHWLRQL
jgi:predicted alpha/beta-fold hydrolase